MTSRLAVRLVVPLALMGLALTGCGSDDPEPGDTAAGASTPSPSASSPARSPSAPETSGGSTDVSEAGVASCAELKGMVTAITGEYPDGVGLATDEVPGEQQVAALSRLVSDFEAAEVSDEEVSPRRDAVVAAAQTILARADAVEPVTEADTTAFTSAFADLGTLCESAN